MILFDKIKLRFLAKKYKHYFVFEESIKENVIIEFIGPPGVGKTTYARLLRKKLESCYHIILGDELRQLLNTRIKRGIHYSEFHDSLLIEVLKYSSLDQSNTEERINRIRFNLSQIEYDALASYFRGLVINDEGISHHCTKLLIELIKMNNNSIDNFLKNRIIVFINEEPHIILNRIRQRQEKDKTLWYGHKGLNDNQIIHITQNDLRIKYELCELLQNRNGSCIILKSDHCTDDNIEIIIEKLKIQLTQPKY